MKIISFMTEKGGTGKSIGAREISGILSMEGYKILLLDLDFQMNISSSLIFDNPQGLNIYDAMINKDLQGNIVKVTENLDIIPGSLKMRHLDDDLETSVTADYILKDGLSRIDGYDYAILDCRPDMKKPETNALIAADFVLIPIEPHTFSLEGFDILDGYVRDKQYQIKPTLKYKGYLNRVPNDKSFLEGIQELLEDYKDDMFKTAVRENVKIKEASICKEFIVDYSPRSNGAVDFKNLAKEVKEWLKSSQID